MRIISGKNKGRKITAPSSLPVRPTTDMAKESIFNILNNNFDFSSSVVLDLFSGTGNIAYEFVSRGCESVIALDIDKQCIRFIKQTAALLNYSEITAIHSDYQSFIKRAHKQFDIIFADPPYGMDNTESIPDLIWHHALLKPDGWLIIEHDKHIEFDQHSAFFDHRKYGKVNFSIFQMQNPT